jgi:transcription elongation factor
MYLYYFQSYLCNEENCRLENLKKSEVSIKKYIESENRFEEEVFYDLFLVKKEMVSEEEFSKQILIYTDQYPEHKDFFDTLGSTFREKEVSLPN